MLRYREKRGFFSFFPVSIAEFIGKASNSLLLSVKEKQSYKNTVGFIIYHSTLYFMNKETYKSSSNDCLHKVDCWVSIYSLWITLYTKPILICLYINCLNSQENHGPSRNICKSIINWWGMDSAWREKVYLSRNIDILHGMINNSLFLRNSSNEGNWYCDWCLLISNVFV